MKTRSHYNQVVDNPNYSSVIGTRSKNSKSEPSAMEIEEQKADFLQNMGQSAFSSNARQSQPNPNLQIGLYLKKAEKFKFERIQGKRLENNDRQWILRLYYWMKTQNLFSGLSETKLCQTIGDIACCSKSLVQTIIKEDEVDLRDRRGHTMPKILNESIEEEVKESAVQHIKENLENGIPISTKDLRSWINEEQGIDLNKSTAWRYVSNWGISWKKLQQEEYRKERNYVLTQRLIFLREVNREMNIPLKSCRHRNLCSCDRRRKIIFIDESYLHQHHVSNYGLTVEDFPLHKPSGKGKRIVIAAGFTDEGWLGFNYGSASSFFPNQEQEYNTGSIKYWPAKVGGEYHKNFNSENFERFFVENILRNLTEPSLLIMDRASYHTTFQPNEFFPSKAKKEALKVWLRAKNIPFDENSLKNDLRLLALSHWETPKNKIETIAETSGIKKFGYPHRVLYLPPYHPEFNAIEFAWGRIKDYAGKHPTYNIEEILEDTLPNAFLEVTPDKSKNIVKHILDKYREELNKDIDPLLITQKIQEIKNELI